MTQTYTSRSPIRLDVPRLAKLPVEIGVVIGILVSIRAVSVPFTARLLVWFIVAVCSVLMSRDELARAIIPIPHVLFVLWWAGSVSWSIAPDASIEGLMATAPGVIGMTMAAIVLPQDRFLRATAIAAQAMVWITAVILVIDPSSRLRAATRTRPGLQGWRGAFGHKNGLAIALVIALALILSFAPKGWIRTATLSLMAVLFVGARSATGLVGALAVIVTYGFLKSQQNASRRMRATTSALAAMGLAFFAAAVTFALPAVLAAYGKDITFTGRTTIWQSVGREILNRPFFGYGHEAVFRNPPGPLSLQISRESGFNVPHPHQGYLDLALGLGLVGLLLYGFSIATTLAISFRLQTVDPDLALGTLVLLVGILILSMSESVLLTSVSLGLVGAFQVLAMRRVGSASIVPP